MTTSTAPEIIEFVLDTAVPLPSEPPAGVFAVALWQVVLQLVAELRQAQAEVAELQAELQLQRAKRFGRSSEKQEGAGTSTEASSESDLDQKVSSTEPPSVLSPTRPADPPSLETKPSQKRQRGAQVGHCGSGRHIPPQLPRTVRVVELPEGERNCPDCGQPYRVTGLTEDSHEVDIQVQVRVIQYRRTACDD